MTKTLVGREFEFVLYEQGKHSQPLLTVERQVSGSRVTGVNAAS